MSVSKLGDPSAALLPSIVVVSDRSIVRTALSHLLAARCRADVYEADGAEAAHLLVIERSPRAVVVDAPLATSVRQRMAEHARLRSAEMGRILLDDVEKPTSHAHNWWNIVLGWSRSAETLVEACASYARAAPHPPLATLTIRQWQVAALLAEGLSNMQIAARLGISVSTVKHHVGSTLVALGALNRLEVALMFRSLRGKVHSAASEQVPSGR